MSRCRARLWHAALAVALFAPLAQAQVVPNRPRPVQQQGAGRGRTQSPDSVAKNLPKANWGPLDSVALELLKRPGMSSVRYQGEAVEFRASSGVVKLSGKTGARAVVERDQTSLIADTIEFAQQSDSIRANGDTIVMHDPSHGDDFFALHHLAYDLSRREGTAWDVSTSTQTTQTWYVEAHRAGFAAADSAAGRDNMFYGADGTITSCTDSVLHYHFGAKEIKRVSNDFLVARNVTMYVMGVPVMWLPFIFQDTRSGRRSGILTPRFGITELVRNSPNYRRTVENLGYYFALSDYLDLATSVDWRSSADATDADPGWTRWNAEVRYRWLNRFASGRIGASFHTLSNGTSNTQISWSHTQDFSTRSHLTTNLNFATSTSVQRQTALAPLAALATIASQANYQRDLGQMQLSIGGTRRQYPGRPQVDQDFPNLNLTSRPLSLGEWLTWTPGLSVTTSTSSHLDAQGDFSRKYVQRADGTIDSVKIDRSTHSSAVTLTTPLKVFDFQITAAIRANDRGNDYPELRTIVDPVDTSRKSTRVYERTWLSQVDFDLGMNLPNFFSGTWNLVPSISMANVASGAFLVRSERTGSRWVAQGKRFSYGLGISPTFFALYGGFGPVARLRHSIQTTLSYSYSPAKAVSADYLAALGQTQTGFLGSLAQNRITLGIQQNIEAKLKSPGDSLSPDGGRKIKLLSMQFSPLTWDFERAAKSKSHSGFATDRFDVSLRSDLLPGFDAGVSYSLFQGSVLSDSAVFSPYLESVRASFSLGAGSGLGALFGRLFGGPALLETTATARDTSGAPAAGAQAPEPIAGSAGQSIRGSGLDVPTGKGLEAQISFTLNQQRPPVGGHVVDYDPTLQCAPYKDVNALQYDICVRNALAAPPTDVNATQTTAGGTFFRVPAQANVQARLGFSLTPKWAASWSTNYDFQRSEFGLQSVTLRREMHDWDAVFGFTQAPNGNFSFTFFIALKAEPDIKFDYNRSTYGSQSGTTPP
ncbi:MAG TPA: putative LPS assembly protein LptD [Gemmatimonadaceae bacterium]|nr:putative LPS assembly protein LptD [Gemmatimonadaceae bacterium]